MQVIRVSGYVVAHIEAPQKGTAARHKCMQHRSLSHFLFRRLHLNPFSARSAHGGDPASTDPDEGCSHGTPYWRRQSSGIVRVVIVNLHVKACHPAIAAS